MSVKYSIEIPEKIIKTLGFKESEMGATLKKELAAYSERLVERNNNSRSSL